MRKDMRSDVVAMVMLSFVVSMVTNLVSIGIVGPVMAVGGASVVGLVGLGLAAVLERSSSKANSN